MLSRFRRFFISIKLLKSSQKLHVFEDIDSIENPQGGVTAAPSFFASLGLPVPPSRKSFALSCRVSASSRHISALFWLLFWMAFSCLAGKVVPGWLGWLLVSSWVAFGAPRPPKSRPGASKIEARGSKIEVGALQNASLKTSCF